MASGYCTLDSAGLYRGFIKESLAGLKVNSRQGLQVGTENASVISSNSRTRNISQQ